MSLRLCILLCLLGVISCVNGQQVKRAMDCSNIVASDQSTYNLASLTSQTLEVKQVPIGQGNYDFKLTICADIDQVHCGSEDFSSSCQSWGAFGSRDSEASLGFADSPDSKVIGLDNGEGVHLQYRGGQPIPDAGVRMTEVWIMCDQGAPTSDVTVNFTQANGDDIFHMYLSSGVACPGGSVPSEAPSDAPSEEPSEAPSEAPADAPVDSPTVQPTTAAPTTIAPTNPPTTAAPTPPVAPTFAPTNDPQGFKGPMHGRELGIIFGFVIAIIFLCVVIATLVFHARGREKWLTYTRIKEKAEAAVGPTEGIVTEDEPGINDNGFNTDPVLTWLKSFGYEHYYDKFEEHGYDMKTLKYCKDDDLMTIGIGKPGHRKAMLSEIAKLRKPKKEPEVPLDP